MESIAFIDLQAQRERLGDSIDKAILRVLEHGKFIMGPEVFELEERLSEYTGATHTISCSSGTDALLMVLLALEVGPGDAVFVPSFTFAATAEVVALVGASPVFIDIEPYTYNMDPGSLLAGIDVARRAGLRPRVVIPVDLFGQPADYDAIGPIARENALFVLADGAQSFGATWRGRRVGVLGIATTTSFFPAKPLGCYGDGGAIFTDDDDLAARLRSIRVHGQGEDKYDNVRIGINGRLDTVQAAVLLEKLNVFDEELASRQLISHRYNAALMEAFECPVIASEATSAWAQYVFRTTDRDGLAAHLAESGIPTAIYYPRPLHLQGAYRSAESVPDPSVSVESSRAVLSLPFHPYLHGHIVDSISEECLRWHSAHR